MTLIDKEIERQDYVDGEIHTLIYVLCPKRHKLDWDIEMIGEVRDVIENWLVNRKEICTKQEFYPSIGG